jgi:tricorn protease
MAGSFAFVSGRPARIWTSQIDGTGRRQVASVGAELTIDSWSPDGRNIVYSANVDGNEDVYVVDAAGGQPKRRTFETSNDGPASWSRNSRWIYFASTRAAVRIRALKRYIVSKE